MIPRSSFSLSRPRAHRRLSRDSFSDSSSGGEGNVSSNSGSNDTDVHINHYEFFLDNHLPPEFFRQDVIRLIHHLRIPGWRSVELDMADDLDMTRISGAFTNAVYRVKAPTYLIERLRRDSSGRPHHHRLPPALLLRVYGPQVGLLIDREEELATVAHLTKHKIGPRLLGTFTNGRFEQFLNAKPLTQLELRQPDISILIAKRMRDLHDNVPLLPSQRAEGPFVWQNLRKWKHIAFEQVAKLEASTPGITKRIFGATGIEGFWAALESYKLWVTGQYSDIHAALVFSHNDTQHGNILRLDPPRGSPLLHPHNEHRQLVVIDFEYSGANPRAYDIANHFCEWMYDYNHPSMSYHMWTDLYPTKEEQLRFINSYVEHGSQDFDEEKMEAEVADLMTKTEQWIPGVSAHWAIWGIIQSPTEEEREIREDLLLQQDGYEVRPGSPPAPVSVSPPQTTPLASQAQVESLEAEDDHFDHIIYAAEKVELFWKYVQSLGIPTSS